MGASGGVDEPVGEPVGDGDATELFIFIIYDLVI
jgi:hypothetical protein